jgi:hypothetical protein
MNIEPFIVFQTTQNYKDQFSLFWIAKLCNTPENELMDQSNLFLKA